MTENPQALRRCRAIPRSFWAARGLLAAMAAMAALVPASARASLIVHRTRDNGANAVRIGSHTFTIDRWIQLRQTNPGWFARNMPRVGRALDMGKDALLARRDRNPRRFDRYHRYLGWLLRDPHEDVLTSTGEPPAPRPIPPLPTPPVVVPPSPPEPPPGGSGGGGGGHPGVQAVPEPSSWVLAALGGAALGLGNRRGRRWLAGRIPSRGRPRA